MTLTEAEERALKILKQVMEEKVNSTNVEVCFTKASKIIFSMFILLQMASVKVGGKFEVYDKEKLEEIISRISKN